MQQKVTDGPGPRGPGPAESGSTIGDIIEPAVTVAPGTVVHQLHEMLANGSPFDSVVVATGNGVPVGLVMSYSLTATLSTKFGLALYEGRSVRNVMNADPMIVDVGSSLESVARNAMTRGDRHVYDSIIVTREGRLAGTVSVQRLLDTMARVQSVLETAGAAAHELNQPLQVVYGYADLLLNDKLEGKARLDALRLVRVQADRMAEIIRRLQNITSYKTQPYTENTRIVDLGCSSSAPEPPPEGMPSARGFAPSRTEVATVS
jgi:signal transduction histidine kinase